MSWLAALFAKGVVERFTGPLLQAYQAKLNAKNDTERIEAETAIKRIEASRDIAVIEASRRWSATSVGRWLIVVPFGLWWAAIYLVQIINPWLGLNLVVRAVPPDIYQLALILVPAIVVADAGATALRRMGK
jgi:hypothetical protein